MSPQDNTVISAEGDTVSAIAYRIYGSSRGRVEEILERNPALCQQPAVLPAGIAVTLPANQTETVKTVPTLNLWD